MSSERAIQVTITPGTIITVILSLLLVGLVFFLKDLVLVVLTAIVIASAIEPGTKFFIRFGLPRVVGVLIIYIGIVAALFCFFYFFLPPLIREASGFTALLPEYLKSFQLPGEAKTGLSLLGFGSGPDSKSLTDAIFSLRDVFASSSSGAFHALSVVFGGIISFALIIVLSFYFAVQDTGIDDFLKLITPIKKHEYIVSLWRRSQHKIGRWMQGQLILSCIIFILLYISLSIFGVHYALLLSIIAAVLELIPVFGSIIAAIPAVAIALISGGTSLALITVLIYLVVNQFQANLVHPLVVQKVVGVPPILVILAIIAGSQIAGFLGIILSVPMAAAAREFISDVQHRKQRRHEESSPPSLF